MQIGDEVGWKWASGIAVGTIESIHPERVEIESKGANIVRNGTEDDPALIIRNDKDVHIVKLQHEVQLVT